MKLEFSILLTLLIGLLPALLVFMSMFKRGLNKDAEIKKLEKEALVLHNTILDLEKEVVSLKNNDNTSGVVQMNEKKTVAV